MTILKKTTNKEQQRNTSFYLSGLMNKILTACYDRNCDNIVYILHKSKTFINASILSWDRIKPRYFLKAQGKSFHFRIIVLRFLAAFPIAKLAFVGRHRTHITNGHCTRYA